MTETDVPIPKEVCGESIAIESSLLIEGTTSVWEVHELRHCNPRRSQDLRRVR